MSTVRYTRWPAALFVVALFAGLLVTTVSATLYLITPQPKYVPLCTQKHGRLAAIPKEIVDCYRGSA